jgi:hypothetical protein
MQQTQVRKKMSDLLAHLMREGAEDGIRFMASLAEHVQ